MNHALKMRYFQFLQFILLVKLFTGDLQFLLQLSILCSELLILIGNCLHYYILMVSLLLHFVYLAVRLLVIVHLFLVVLLDVIDLVLELTDCVQVLLVLVVELNYPLILELQLVLLPLYQVIVELLCRLQGLDGERLLSELSILCK